MANATKDAPPEVMLTAAGDPTPPASSPLIMTDCYFELGGVNLRCTVKHLEVTPEVKQVTTTTFCAETDWPGTVKWHLKVTFYMDYSAGSVFTTLNAAVSAYTANQTPVNFKARPYSSKTASAVNPIISGMVIPQPFDYISGDAGAASEVSIDWVTTSPPTVDNGSVAATGAVAGAPGYYTPSGATTPANLAGLASVVASPATNWTSGQYVITADLLAANWTGAAWASGKHA